MKTPKPKSGVPKGQSSLQTKPSSINGYWNRFKILSRKKRVLIALSVVTVFYLVNMFLFGAVYQLQHRNDKVILGTSFSKNAAEELGLDWKANFIALQEELNIRNFRLMSFWYNHEPHQGTYDFSDLDWQLDEAAKRGGKVSLSVGLRQPRWPECHQPEWAKELEKTDKAKWYAAISNYLQVVVERYKHHPAIESWHLENEYFNRNFGQCDDFSKQRLKDEIALIKKLDNSHPIIITLADQLGFPLTGPHPDIYSTSLYRGNYVKFVGYFPYPIPTHFYSSKAFFIKLLHGKDIYIHELQLEPWGPRPTKELSVGEQDYYMDTSRMRGNIDFAVDTGMKKMNLWGAEWWYWRKVKFNDPGPWNLVREAGIRYQVNSQK